MLRARAAATQARIAEFRADIRRMAEAAEGRRIAELRAAAEARRIAEMRAAGEGGQWFLIDAWPWEDNGYNQQVRMVLWGRLRAQHPANWWEYDMVKNHPIEWLHKRGEGQTRPYPQPASAPQPAADRGYWSRQVPVPPAATPVQRTAQQNQAINTIGPTAVNANNNRYGNPH